MKPLAHIAKTLLLMGAALLWQSVATADTLPIHPNPSNSTITLEGETELGSTPGQRNTHATDPSDRSLGLKSGAKSKIELYGTVEVGYSKWSHKN